MTVNESILIAALERMIENEMVRSEFYRHPTGLFCRRCDLDSRVRVHREECPVLQAQRAIAAVRGDKEPQP